MTHAGIPFSEWYHSPETISGKLMLLTTLFLSFVTYTAYAGAIISELASESVPVTSAHDLQDHGFTFLYNPDVYHSFFDAGVSESI
jgi:hypothetical protein